MNGGTWKKDLKEAVLEYVESGSKIMNSDTFTINGQPRQFYPCSNNGKYTHLIEKKLFVLIELTFYLIDGQELSR